MKKVKLALYDERYYSGLEKLLKMFQREVYNSDTQINTRHFVDNHHGYIYMVLDECGGSVGFSSFIYNGWYGMREPTLGNDFIYIMPEYRRSRAMHLISIQAGVLCKDNDIPLEHYIASEGSAQFHGRLTGSKLYTAYEYSVAEVTRETERLKTKVRIKE